MSLNPSRSDKSDNQYRQLGRSGSSGNQQRSFSGKGGGSGGGTAPPTASSLPLNRSFKKSNNAQGGQSRINASAVNSDLSNVSAPQRSVQNGGHVQHSLHGASDVPVAAIATKPAELSSVQKTNRGVPKPPSSQSAPMNPDSAATTTPAKGPVDASRTISFQFGTISPCFMNGMQVPARTSSAPPNLDEQKRDQARHDSYRSGPSLPIPSVPKQQLRRKDVGTVDQSTTAEAYPIPKAKKDSQISSGPPLAQTHKPSVPMGGMSMPMAFHQPQVPVQFGAPNPQIQSQGVAPSSLQMPLPMPLHMGNASQVQQQVFVPNLQPHPMQHQGIMHQGQSLSFAAQMGPQIPPQLGNLGVNISPQFSQHQTGKFGGLRKAVKITDPKTHEELRLEKRVDSYMDGGSLGTKSHSNVPQSQPISSFAPTHPMNYYSNTYNANSVFYAAPSSLPLSSTQVNSSSQTPRYNYSVSQGLPTMSVGNPLAHTLSGNKTGAPGPGNVEPPSLERVRDIHSSNSSSPLSTAPVSVKQVAGSTVDKVVDPSSPINSPAVGIGYLPKLLKSPGKTGLLHSQRENESSTQLPKSGVEVSSCTAVPVSGKQSAGGYTFPVDRATPTHSLAIEDSAASLVMTIAEGRSIETLSRSNSIMDHQKKPVKKGHIQPESQVGGQSTFITSLSSRAPDHHASYTSGVSETAEAKTGSASSATSDVASELTGESLSVTGSVTCEPRETNADIGEGSICETVKNFGHGDVIDSTSADYNADQDRLRIQDERLKNENLVLEEQSKLPEVSKQGTSDLDMKSIALKPVEVIEYTEPDPIQKVTTYSLEPTTDAASRELDGPLCCPAEIDRTSDNLVMHSSSNLASVNAESSSFVSPMAFLGDKASVSYGSSNISDGSKEVSVTKSDTESTLINEGVGPENTGGGLVSFPGLESKDKSNAESIRAKNTVPKGRRKRKEILQKADAAGTTSDLYLAYKGPEEKKDSTISLESTSTTVDLKQVPADATQKDDVTSEKGLHNKAEPDDWEDAAEISTPKLETSRDGELGQGGLIYHDNDGIGILTKKYTRDFLLKFADQCTDLPVGFEITSDLAEALMGANVNISHLVDRDSYPSPGRNMDKPMVVSRPDRRGSGTMEDDKWSKLPGPFNSGRDLRLDLGYGGNVGGFRPGQNYGVLKNPRAQTPVQYAGGILSGPMQSLGSQGGMQRNSPDTDRWQRQKGLIPSPQTPLQVMHKAEKKYEVGRVTDEEQSKQRQLKAILNKLTPQNFEKLFQQVKAVNIDSAVTLTGVISQIFDKALMEPTFCEMYANFCHHLAGELPGFSEDNEKITFKRLLLNKCQEEFERGEREQEEANRVEEGEIKQSEEAREEKRVQARRRMLGNIRLIGELYKKRMLTERIMHECIKKLLGQYQNPDEEDVEALCKLMSTIGEMIDHPKAKEHMDAYFDMMAKLSNNMKLSARVRFMLKDAIDLRKNKWQQRRKVEGPKKIEELHRDAAQERQAQVSRLTRGPSIGSSARRGPSMDFGSRGSTLLSSPNAQMGGFRAVPPQVRGYGTQDIRLDDRQSYEGRPLSVPLPQRPIGDDSITLGPQGGLARGMSIRGPTAISSVPLADMITGPGDSRRVAGGVNGYNSLAERMSYNSREVIMPRYVGERFLSPSAYDQSSGQERNMPYGNRDIKNHDRSFDRLLATSPPTRVQGPAFTQNVPSEKVWPEERLRDMSISAIKEFYSAKDEKEVALCIKDLNSPSFHPMMISLWVTDSFERKDMERDLLAELIVNLAKSQDGILTQVHLLKGFESVLTTLEDAVNDAPKAAEFLGGIFAKVISEDVIPLVEIAQLIYRGGEEPGSLVRIGLAGDVLGSILEIVVHAEKGEAILKEIRTSSKLRLEDFRPPDPMKSRKLEKFI